MANRECPAHETRDCEKWITIGQYEEYGMCEPCERHQWLEELKDMEWTYNHS